MSSSHPAPPENHALASLNHLNRLDEETFTGKLGAIYEHSPWIARAAWRERPFTAVSALEETFRRVVKNASPRQKLDLLCAHPDLAGRLAAGQQLTAESTREQKAAGLDQLNPNEREEISRLNTAYTEKFGFPFIICARLNDKAAILTAMQTRIHHNRDTEISRALAEVHRIAALRLTDILHP